MKAASTNRKYVRIISGLVAHIGSISPFVRRSIGVCKGLEYQGKGAASLLEPHRASGALVIVSVHWGAEYQGGASGRQKSLAQQFADAGAALIWGHHPHVLQPAAWIAPSTTGGAPLRPPLRTLVLYSLGNALFDQGGLDDTRRSALVVVTLDAQGVKTAEAIPFEIDIVNSLLVAPDAETAKKIQDRLNLP